MGAKLRNNSETAKRFGAYLTMETVFLCFVGELMELFAFLFF